MNDKALFLLFGGLLRILKRLPKKVGLLSTGVPSLFLQGLELDNLDKKIKRQQCEVLFYLDLECIASYSEFSPFIRFVSHVFISAVFFPQYLSHH